MKKIMTMIGAVALAGTAALLASACAKSADSGVSDDAADSVSTEALAEAEVVDNAATVAVPETGAVARAQAEADASQPPMASSPKLDSERIVAMVQQPKITEADNDFLLTQLEIIGEQTKGMTGPQMDKYLENMTEEQLMAYATVLMGLAASAKDGSLTPAQLSAYNAIVARYPNLQ